MNYACEFGRRPISMTFQNQPSISSNLYFSNLSTTVTNYSVETMDDCNICRQNYFYASLQANSSPGIPHLYAVAPTWNDDMGTYNQDQLAHYYSIIDPLPYFEDILGSYSTDGCWYPNSSPIKPHKSVPSQVLPLTTKDFYRKPLKAKLFSQEKIAKIYAKFHTPRLPSERPILLGQKPSNYSPGLEIVWNQHFSYLFSAFPEDVWSFGPRNPSEGKVSNWAVFRDMAKVRFCCKKCKHGWTSMHGPVVFYYMYDEYVRKGSVRFILTGQKCIECKSQDFETPMWYPEEAQKVMTNLYFEIASKVYKKATPPLITNRRHGRPRQQHVASDCQGCHLGICKPKLEINNNSDNNNNKTV